MKRTAFALTLAAILLATPAFPASAPTSAKPKPRAHAGAARLDEVHIKGEIPEPQVLFVVGRERRRFLDFQHRHYLAARTGAGPTGPSWIRVVDQGRSIAE